MKKTIKVVLYRFTAALLLVCLLVSSCNELFEWHAFSGYDRYVLIVCAGSTFLFLYFGETLRVQSQSVVEKPNARTPSLSSKVPLWTALIVTVVVALAWQKNWADDGWRGLIWLAVIAALAALIRLVRKS